MTVAVPCPTASITHLFWGNSRTRNSMMSSFVGIRLSNLREYWRNANAISLELLGRAESMQRNRWLDQRRTATAIKQETERFGYGAFVATRSRMNAVSATPVSRSLWFIESHLA